MVVSSSSACPMHEKTLWELKGTGHGGGAWASGLWEEGIEESLGAGRAGWGHFPEQWAPLCMFTPRARRPLAQLCLAPGQRQVLLLGAVGGGHSLRVALRARGMVGAWHPHGPGPPCPVPRRTTGHRAHLPVPEAGLHPELHEGREADVSGRGRESARTRPLLGAPQQAWGSRLVHARPSRGSLRPL